MMAGPSSSRGSLRLIYSTLKRRDATILFPIAILLSIAAGAVPTLTARVIGDAFQAFTTYNGRHLQPNDVPQSEKDQFRNAIVTSIWQLCSLAVGTMALSTCMISVWIIIGEKVAKGWRLQIFRAFNEKDMAWYETELRQKQLDDEDAIAEDGGDAIGAGGLMAKFSRETDDIRIASSQTAAQILESLSTIVTASTLAFIASWSLTFVILATMPVLLCFIQFVQQRATGWHLIDMQCMAQAGKILEQTAQAIATVKALCIQKRQTGMIMKHVDKALHAWDKLAWIYGGRLGITAWMSLMMFASGFWYGSYLVQSGKATPGDVFTAFWSCVLIMNAVQPIIETLTWLEMGKVAAASLTNLVSSKNESRPVSASLPSYESATHIVNFTSENSTSDDHKNRFSSIEVSTPVSPLASAGSRRTRLLSGTPSTPRPQPMKRIWPNSPFHGEVLIQNLTFSYPSRPVDVVLHNVNMFIPSAEMTFILGQSGSGKSTIAHLLLGMYKGYRGTILIDDQDLQYLDSNWTKAHIAAIDQQPIIFDMSVHDNVALGMCGSIEDALKYGKNHVPLVSREIVKRACTMALLDHDIGNLSNGYDTLLGSGGVNLSGGQKQRLAVARAIVRDPPILILDEATSALDHTSRSLVMAMLRHWRRGKTTIVITHDLSQVDKEDFVYVLEHGILVEQGYRMDLEERQEGRFIAQLEAQQLDSEEEPESEAIEQLPSPTGLEWRASRALDKHVMSSQHTSRHARSSIWGLQELDATPFQQQRDLRRPGHHRAISSLSSVSTQTSASSKLRPLRLPQEQQMKTLQEHGTEQTLEMTSVFVSHKRPAADARARKEWSEGELQNSVAAMIPSLESEQQVVTAALPFQRVILMALRVSWRMQPNKTLFVGGIVTTIIGGAVQPLFSFILGKLLSTMAERSEQQKKQVTILASVVIGLAFIDGIVQLLRFALLQLSANRFVRTIRAKMLANVIQQDKAWYDEEDNNSGNLLIRLIKDPEDAKAFTGRIIGEMLVVIVMTFVVIVWAFTVSWQLTLAGLALGPVFYAVVAIQSKVIMHYENQNKIKRETVSKQFYNTIQNVWSIRAMALQEVFSRTFVEAVEQAEKNGIRAAPFSGFGYGVKDGCMYLAQAFLYYIGCILTIKGYLTLESMMIVFNLIIFGVSFASNVLAYLPNLSKTLKAIWDAQVLLHLDSLGSLPSEAQGRAHPRIRGAIAFENVSFSYPSRPDKLVLDGCSFEVEEGETVALVGQSGCGKSTIAALLQRLYPCDAAHASTGRIVIDGQWPLHLIETNHLRENIAYVSQSTDLFDDTIRNNLLLANPMATEADLWQALRLASCDDFIEKLTDGIDTVVGERADNLSGGQKQRLSIARCVIRSFAKIRILDECTSALDGKNQQVIGANLLRPDGTHPTTLVVTHNIELMQQCSRIIVLQNGKVVQSGSFAELMSQRGGTFSKLANAGEWGY